MATSRKPKTTTPAAITADLVVTTLPTSDQLRQVVALGGKLFIEKAGSEADIVNRVALASSASDVFGSGELTSTKEIMGTSIQVTEIESIRPSDFDDSSGLGVYIVVKAIDPDGQSLNVAVGSTDGIVKLVRLNEIGALPRWVAFERASKPTKNGFHPINLVDRELEMGE